MIAPAPRALRYGAALLAVVGLVLLAGSLASVASAKDGQVTVRAAGVANESVTIKLSELGINDINNRRYELDSGPATISGHSLLQVMEAAAAESDTFDVETLPGVDIDRPSSGTIKISGAELRDRSAFPDGQPVFYEDSGATVFVMPGRGGQPGNSYRFDEAPIGISISTAARFEIDLSASRKKIKAGQEVTFTATVKGQAEGEALSFDWSFGDGSSRSTTRGRISHTFKKEGEFSVILNVTGDSGSGQTGIQITVGEAESRERDKEPEEKDPTENDGGDGGSGGDGGLGAGLGTGSGDFGTGAGTGDPGGLGTGTPPLPSPPPTEPEPKKEQPVDDGLIEVQGELVDPQTTTVVTPSDGEVVESADPAPSDAEQGGFGLPGEAWTLAGVGLLLGLGGFAELRVFSRIR